MYQAMLHVIEHILPKKSSILTLQKCCNASTWTMLAGYLFRLAPWRSTEGRYPQSMFHWLVGIH